MSKLSEWLKGAKLLFVIDLLKWFVSQLSDPFRQAIVEFVTKLEKTAPETPGKTDDILLVLLRPVKGWLTA